jgi:hypothetical protein
LVFQAQATVVYCGVYQIVHKFCGKIFFSHSTSNCLVDVHVLAANFLQGIVKNKFHIFGLASVLVNIEVIKYAIFGEIASSTFVCSFSLILKSFQFLSIIFKIGVNSFLFHIEAIVEYAVASSKGVISQVHKAIGDQ